jgi:hypothetical protein
MFATHTKQLNVRFEALTVVNIQVTVWFDVAPYICASQGPAVSVISAEQGSSGPQLHIITKVRRGFGSEIGFIDYFNTRLVTTLNYSAMFCHKGGQ